MENTNQKRFACHVALTSATLGQFSTPEGIRPNVVRGIKVTSPRTGRTIAVWDRAYGRIDRRIPCRVAGAVARGLHHVEFSIDELKALKDAADAFLVAMPTGKVLPPIRYRKLYNPKFCRRSA